MASLKNQMNYSLENSDSKKKKKLKQQEQNLGKRKHSVVNYKALKQVKKVKKVMSGDPSEQCKGLCFLCCVRY